MNRKIRAGALSLAFFFAGTAALANEPQNMGSGPSAAKKAATTTFSTPEEYELKGERTVRLDDSVNRTTAVDLIRKLRFLDAHNPDNKEIVLVINSGGGNVDQGLAILDTLRNLKSDVRTVCEGRAMSMAAILLAAGTPGKRTSLPNCRIMFHQLSAGNSGTFSEMDNNHEQFAKMNENLMGIVSRLTNRTKADVTKALKQDVYFNPDQALDFGAIDSVVSPSRPLPDAGQRAFNIP